MFAATVAFFVLAGAAVYLAVVSARFGDRIKSVMASAASVALALFSAGFFWLGSSYPTFNFRNNQGFAEGWSCLNLGAAQVCGREDPGKA